MKIIAHEHLIEFWTIHPDCRSALQAWHAEATTASWATPVDIRAKYGSVSILKAGRAVFNICGNKYRLVVQINYGLRTIFIRFVGTHEEYDEINAQNI